MKGTNELSAKSAELSSRLIEPDDNIINPLIMLLKIRESAITKVTGDGLTRPNWVTTHKVH
jgi:hypothetical protein